LVLLQHGLARIVRENPFLQSPYSLDLIDFFGHAVNDVAVVFAVVFVAVVVVADVVAAAFH